MPRPRRTTAETFFDCFSDFPLDDQAAALRIMTEIHRQKQRDAKRQPKPNAPAAVAVGTKLFPDLADATDPQRNAALRDTQEKPQ